MYDVPVPTWVVNVELLYHFTVPVVALVTFKVWVPLEQMILFGTVGAGGDCITSMRAVDLDELVNDPG